CGQGTKVTRTF
nr:immunoglobulin light chain junction region [Macaca mulatta]MOW40279.1 immunoglobulin light chain junction region [Macaca mulatta]